MTDLFFHHVTTQAIGVIAFIFAIVGFSQKSDKKLKIIIILDCFFFAGHFFLLGAYSAMAVNALNAVRVGFSLKFHNSNIMMLLFIFAYIILGYFTYQNLQDILPIFSGCLGTYAMYKLSGIKMRLCLLASGLSWLTHDIIYKSIGGIITEIFLQIANIRTIFRLRNDKQHELSNT